MKGKILVVEDEQLIREQIQTKLELNGCEVWEADSALALKSALAGPQPDVVVLDVRLDPNKEDDRAGLDMLPQIKKRWPETEVIVLTGHGSVEMALEAGRLGAYNFLSKPFQSEKLLADVSNALERHQQTEETSMLRRALETMSGTASPVFQSVVMRDVVRTVERIAPSDVAVLITGESGTGKEVIADLIHAFSPRCKTRKCVQWAGRPPTRPTAVWSQRPIARQMKRFKWVSCVKICTTASAPSRSICRRCVSGVKTSCRWPIRF